MTNVVRAGRIVLVIAGVVGTVMQFTASGDGGRNDGSPVVRGGSGEMQASVLAVVRGKAHVVGRDGTTYAWEATPETQKALAANQGVSEVKIHWTRADNGTVTVVGVEGTAASYLPGDPPLADDVGAENLERAENATPPGRPMRSGSEPFEIISVVDRHVTVRRVVGPSRNVERFKIIAPQMEHLIGQYVGRRMVIRWYERPLSGDLHVAHAEPFPVQTADR